MFEESEVKLASINILSRRVVGTLVLARQVNTGRRPWEFRVGVQSEDRPLGRHRCRMRHPVTALDGYAASVNPTVRSSDG